MTKARITPARAWQAGNSVIERAMQGYDHMLLPPPSRPPLALLQDVVESPAVVGVAMPRPCHRLDRQRLVDQGMIHMDGAACPQIDEFRLIKRQLLQQADDLRRRGDGGRAQRIMVASPHVGEGKTYSAVNLALSIAAEQDKEVLLVDLDLASASVPGLLGLPGGPGLMDALVDPDLDIRGCIMTTDIAGLAVLGGGLPTALDAEYLASARAMALLDLLTENAPERIVLFDTPPVLVSALAAQLARLVGQTVLVVRANQTSAGAIEDAASLLAGCQHIQLVLNGVEFSPSGRRFGSYHGYRG